MRLIALSAFFLLAIISVSRAECPSDPFESIDGILGIYMKWMQASCRASEFPAANLPKCPPGTGFRPLGNHYPAEAVFVSSGSAPSEAMGELLDAIRNTGSNAKLNILVDQRRVSTLKGVELFFERFERDAPELLKSEKEVGFLPQADPQIWVQDWMEMGVFGSSEPAIMELPYRNPKARELAESCGLKFIEKPILAPVDDGSSGGNIEGFPGGVTVVGQDADFFIRHRLRSDQAGPLVAIDTDWLNVGHIDEIVTVVPTADPAPCDYMIAYASPGLGLELLRKEAPSAFEGTEPLLAGGKLASCLGSAIRSDGIGANFLAELRRFNDGAASLKRLSCREFAKANAAYEAKINAEATRIESVVAARTECRKVTLQAFPQLFVPRAPGESYGSFRDHAVAFNPSLINALVLGKNVIVPHQPYPAFENALASSLKVRGVSVQFLKKLWGFTGGGGLHCETNVMRRCGP